MIYTNDETDKSIRQKNFLLSVYALPIAVSASLCGLIYLATSANYLPKEDAFFGYMTSLFPGILLFSRNSRNWLKMPDGTFHNIKDIVPTTKINMTEPSLYEEEYFYSRKEKITSTLMGAGLTVASVWLATKGSKSVLIPVSMAAGGIFIGYTGIKGLLDKSATLKLATTGLWTKKLGFVDYNDLVKAQVVQDTSGKTPQTILEIYLKGTVFAEANQPDERLNLTNVDGKEYVEMVLVNLMNKRHEVPA
ncbi:hypothetical protein QEG73_10805 [Chitinophagaceae bacterium 26-R-25]|nr:hypothetical protein [Chitinophagaceae bacterium 26-R-25]